MMASQKVHLLRYAQASSLRRTLQVRRIPQLSQALQLELFAVTLSKKPYESVGLGDNPDIINYRGGKLLQLQKTDRGDFQREVRCRLRLDDEGNIGGYPGYDLGRTLNLPMFGRGVHDSFYRNVRVSSCFEKIAVMLPKPGLA